MENETNKLPEFKVPLIGNFDIVPLDKIFDEKSLLLLQVNEELSLFENEIGNHLLASTEYETLLDLLFPPSEYFSKENVWSIIYDGNIEKAPLIFKNFGKESPGNVTGDVAKAKRSVWANLMLDLGEFNLDNDTGGYEHLLPYVYKVEDPLDGQRTGYCAMFARFDSSGEVSKGVWERILGDDTVVVFIEDDEQFGTLFGAKEFKENECSELDKKIWINAGPEYDEIDIKRKIRKIIDKFKSIDNEKKKLVFIVDLLYQKDKINRIKGTELIGYIRDESEWNPFVIAFTGGKSPFIINSAAKAGADVVIMKARSNSRFEDGHYSAENEAIASNKIDSAGLFDLLWALSKNISRMRFLETIPLIIPEHIFQAKFNYKPVLNHMFYSVEDETPFWRVYLNEWEKNIDNCLVRAIFCEG